MTVANTGTVSLWLYGIFITITILAMIVAFYQIKKGNIDMAKLDKMIELFKYAIVSTAIATVTLAVSDLFKEREQDVKELEYFGKYVDDIKKVDGIEERLLLAKYLSIVAPRGEMRRSWENYYKSVKEEYEEVLKSEAVMKNTDTTNATEEQKAKVENAQKTKELYDRPLVPDDVPEKIPVIYIQYCNNQSKSRVLGIQKEFEDHSWNAPGIDYVEAGCDNSIRYFHDEDRELANRANTLLGGTYHIKKLTIKAPHGQIELWIRD